MSILIKLNHTYIKVYVDIVINGNLLYIINQIDMYMDCFGFIVLEKIKKDKGRLASNLKFFISSVWAKSFFVLFRCSQMSTKKGPKETVCQLSWICRKNIDKYCLYV